MIAEEIHRSIDLSRLPLHTSEMLPRCFPDLKVVARKMERHGQLEIFRSSGRGKIVYSKDDHHSTHRFTIAHELGHWIFDCGRGRAIPDDWVCVEGSRALPERRANFFATELLVPIRVLHEHVKFTIHPDPEDVDAVGLRDQEIQKIAAWFNVSFFCAKRRVFELHRFRSDGYLTF